MEISFVIFSEKSLKNLVFQKDILVDTLKNFHSRFILSRTCDSGNALM